MSLASDLAAALNVRDVYADFRTRYRDDPVAFVEECVAWRPGEGMTDYQRDILATLVAHRRIAVRGPHGLGKTALAAWVTLWFSLTRDGEDWKLLTTAGAWRQLAKFLWPEIGKWSRRLRWDIIGRLPFNGRTELQSLSLKLSTGEAFAVASDTPDLIEGAHAEQLLYLFDESKAIPSRTFDAAEGAFSGAGSETKAEAFALAVSTPGEPQGRFYDIHRRTPGYEDWHTRHVTLAEVLAASRVSQSWVEQRERQWGRGSAVFQNRVLGEFAANSDDGVIPLAWVELAVERWHEWHDAGSRGEGLPIIGVDVGGGHGDASVLAVRYSSVIGELRYSAGDVMETTGRVAGLLANPGGVAVVDAIGIGAGVLARLREQGFAAHAFHASARTEMRDETGELGFLNARAAAWWNMRTLLDPANGHRVALPPDDRLTGDLTAPRWKVGSSGRIQIEGKSDIRKRLGRSTDAADAVIQSFYEPWAQVEEWELVEHPDEGMQEALAHYAGISSWDRGYL